MAGRSPKAGRASGIESPRNERKGFTGKAGSAVNWRKRAAGGGNVRISERGEWMDVLRLGCG
jgi:hypothetical protein